MYTPEGEKKIIEDTLRGIEGLLWMSNMADIYKANLVSVQGVLQMRLREVEEQIKRDEEFFAKAKGKQ